MQQSLEWLSSLDSSKLLAEITEKHVEGTGAWLMMHDAYQAWKTIINKSGLIWVKGKPGCGKSFLAARTIKDLDLFMEASDAHAYAFLRRENKDTNSRKAILASLARQIVSRQPGSVKSLEDQFQARNQSESPDIKFISRVLTEAISNFRTTFIVIDGLDECSDEDGISLAKDLADLAKPQNGPTVKIIVFSRPDAGFTKHFEGSAQIRPDHGHNGGDLKAYFDSEFDNEYGPIQISETDRQKCLKKAQGMFQWVRLFRQRLHNPIIARRILKNIDNMKSGLEPMYDETLSNIDPHLRSTAWLIFVWITHGKRALTGIEMREAVADMTGALQLQELDRESSDEDLVSICANLIFIDRDEHVRLIHDSVRDHLEDGQSSASSAWRKEYQTLLENAHERLGEICLRYLLLKDFEYGPASSTSQLAKMEKNAPLLRYASSTWAWHFSKSLTDDLDETIRELVHSEPRRELCMQMCFDELIEEESIPFDSTSSSLHFVALTGLETQAAKLITDPGQSAWQMNGHCDLAISYSILFEHYEMTVWLLAVMLECQEQILPEEQGTIIICNAAICGWADVLESLLRLSSKEVVGAIFEGGMTILMKTCFQGSLRLHEFLLIMV